MYNQLKKIYKDALIQSSSPHSFSHYLWFASSDNEYFGIEKDSLTTKDILLLETFLQKVEEHQLSMSEKEQWWHELLFNRALQKTPSTQLRPFRFIHFEFSEPLLNKEEWKEALIAFFDSDLVIVWKSFTGGVIVDFLPEVKTEETVPLHDIIDITASDFYSNVKFYIGAYNDIEENLSDFFHWEQKCFELSLKARKQANIHTFQHALPYMLTENMDAEHLPYMTKMFGTMLDDEKELLQSVKVYIENNMNVSLTAKKLFMHRNSLQYRIDKFIERTGIDIKNFQGAMAAYLAIIIIEK
ncbi:helix-turn-helix domain-containing protein [Sutcliffiella horikoshii]|uniref:PucR family transcriptional regulator n=1 Tax=Sutcliffiella horikoshii TaxID=79883 RepID=UPI0038508F18